MNAYELAKKYYPTLWNIDRLKKLVATSKITKAQFKEITGKDYSAA